MISHITIGTSDFNASFRFYEKLFTSIGLALKFHENDVPLAGWVKPGVSRPLIII